ncbi:hypothetical protein [uncultured Stenotrophomonas sp.]|uniref:hypothetical protein n=1 Tax=uncultured Stenotrophomonas sp. TaxID=165438 RepID=UPI0028EDA13E|nr:hypothetical protein [uncultured Stenotrophomonas sp.]
MKTRYHNAMLLLGISASLTGCGLSFFPDSSRDMEVLASQDVACEPPSIEIVMDWGINGVSSGCYIQVGGVAAARDGHVYLRGQYLNGQRTGTWRWLTSDGGLLKESTYDQSNMENQHSNLYVEGTDIEAFLRQGRDSQFEILDREPIECTPPAVKMLRPWEGGSSVGCYISHGTFLAVEGSHLQFRGQYANGTQSGAWYYYDETGRVSHTVKY